MKNFFVLCTIAVITVIAAGCYNAPTKVEQDETPIHLPSNIEEIKGYARTLNSSLIDTVIVFENVGTWYRDSTEFVMLNHYGREVYDSLNYAFLRGWLEIEWYATQKDVDSLCRIPEIKMALESGFDGFCGDPWYEEEYLQYTNKWFNYYDEVEL